MATVKQKDALLVAATGLLCLLSCGSSAELSTTRAVVATINVDAGSMLAKDILPQLCKAFSLTRIEVKSALASANSKLIDSKLTDFRRMEGMIPPGQYMIHEGTTLNQQVLEWLAASENRYSRLLSSIEQTNTLTDSERLVLASMVEAECLSGKYHSKVASVFLNRLAHHQRLQSCASAEYALGFQRPYLLKRDVAVTSKYNTYDAKGLPVGAICSVSDASLSAAVSKSENLDVFYFFYDYMLGEISFFSDYTEFRKKEFVSRKRFNKTSPVLAHSKVNKQLLYQPRQARLNMLYSSKPSS